MKRSTSASSWSALFSKGLEVVPRQQTFLDHAQRDEVLDFARHGATTLMATLTHDFLEIWVDVALNPYFDFDG